MHASGEGGSVGSALPSAAQRQHYEPAVALLLLGAPAGAAVGARPGAAVVLRRILQDRIRHQLALHFLDQIRPVHSEIFKVGEGQVRIMEPEQYV